MNKQICLGKVVAVGFFFSVCLGQAAVNTWDAGGVGVTVWSEPTNWVGDSVPTFAAGDTFDLSKINLVASGTSTVDSNQTLGLINIGDSVSNSNTWALNNSGGAVITLDNGVSSSQINQVSTSAANTISVPLALKGNLAVTNNSATTLTISGTVSSSATSGTQSISTLGSVGGVTLISGLVSDGGTGGKVAVVMNNPNGELKLINTGNSFTGGTTLTAGTARIQTGALGPAGSSLTIDGNVQLRSNDGTATTQNLGTWNISSDFSMDANYGMMTVSGSTAINLASGTRTLNLGTAGQANLDLIPLLLNGTGQTINNGTLRITASGGSVSATAPAVLRFAAAGVTFNNANLEIGANATTRFGSNNAFGTASGTLPNVTVTTGGALNLSGRASDGSGFSLTIASLSGSGNVVNSAFVSGTATLTLNGSTSTTFSGTIKDGGYNGMVNGKIALTKAGSSTQTLTGTNAYTGATSISGGTLLIGGAGSINGTSGVTLNGATAALRYNSSTNLTQALTWTQGRLEGTNWGGALGGLTVGTNQILSPGNSPGTGATTSQTWAGGGTYVWEINDATGTAGTDPGWDLITGTGALTITATSGSKFNINITSLTVGNVAGNATNFSSSTNYNWLLADFTGAITFDATAFALNTAGFSNAFSGTFDIARGDTGGIGGDASQLYITYAVPEPSTAILVSLVLTAAVTFRRRSRI